MNICLSAPPPRSFYGADKESVVPDHKFAEDCFHITNPMGLDLRRAALLARNALQFEATVEIGHGDKAVDGKNLMALVALDVPCGAILTVTAYGPDAPQALQAIQTLFHSAFHEDYAARAPEAVDAITDETNNFGAIPACRIRAKLARSFLPRRLAAVRQISAPH